MDSLYSLICPHLSTDKMDRPLCCCDGGVHQGDLDWLDSDTRGVAQAIADLVDSLRHSNELPLVVLGLNARDEIICRTLKTDAFEDGNLEWLVDELKASAQAIVERIGVPE